VRCFAKIQRKYDNKEKIKCYEKKRIQFRTIAFSRAKAQVRKKVRKGITAIP